MSVTVDMVVRLDPTPTETASISQMKMYLKTLCQVSPCFFTEFSLTGGPPGLWCSGGGLGRRA